MRFSYPGFFQDIFPVKFVKNMTERQSPDRIFCNIEKIAPCKLVDKYKNKKTQAVIIRIGFGSEKKVPFKTETDYQTRNTINRERFSYRIGDGNLIYIKNGIIKFVQNICSN